jgi:hypothetical protein
MIKVEKQLVHFSEREDAFGIMEVVVNQIISGTAETVEDSLKEIKCNQHPYQDTVILISGKHPDSGEMITVNITRFCCSDFKDSIKVNVH